jgi:hypothetical protein
MRVLSAFEQDHEAIFTAIAAANWDTQYLDVSGKVYNKSIFGRIAHFFGFQWNSDIVNTLSMLHGRLRLYESNYKVENEKLQVYYTVVDKVEVLIDRINAKRPANGFTPLSEKLKIRKSVIDVYFNRNPGELPSGLQSSMVNSSAKKSDSKGELAAGVAAEIKK